MSWKPDIARRESTTLETRPHGGNVWDVAEESAIRSGELIDFSSSICPLGPSRNVLNAIKNSLWKISFYPQTDAANLRRLVARQHGSISLRNVIVGNGSCELIYLFADFFVREGTFALIPIPTFSEYESAILRAGGRVEEIKPRDCFKVDVEAILNHICKDSLVFICNPNNPTGNLTKRDDLLKILDLSAYHEALVFIDETFMDFVENQEEYSLAGEVENHRNLFVLRSLTKFHSLAGLRIGYGLASEKTVELLHKAKIPWNVNCLAQTAAEHAIKDHKHAERVRELVARERTFLMGRLKTNRKLRVYDSEANFILIDTRGTDLNGPQIAERALKRGLMIRDCSSFKGLDEFHIRVAIKTRRQNLILLDFLESL